jgi:hypothetical protein
VRALERLGRALSDGAEGAVGGSKLVAHAVQQLLRGALLQQSLQRHDARALPRLLCAHGGRGSLRSVGGHKLCTGGKRVCTLVDESEVRCEPLAFSARGGEL